MKLLTSKILAIFFLAPLLAGSINADSYRQDRDECCRPSCCYECGCNPLYCGALDLQVQAGVAPILWRDRGVFNTVICPLADISSVGSLFNIPKFRTFFHIPWIVGGQVGYALSDNIRVYLEANYVQASAKNNVLLSTVGITPSVAILFNNGKYKLFDAYVGIRYYFDRWCDMVSLFVGMKAGVLHHNRTRFAPTITVTPAAGIVIPTIDLFVRSTVPSGGLNVGLDFCLCGCWSLALTAELVASCGPKSNENIPFGQPGASCTAIAFQPTLPAVPGLNNILIGHIGTELRFPITASLRYSF